MKKLLLSGLMFATMSTAALAAEPLTENQLDTVTAGITYIGPLLSVKINAAIDSVGGLTSLTLSTETFFLVF